MRGLRVWGALAVAALAAAGVVGTAAASPASSAVPTERFVGLQSNPSANGFAVVIGDGPVHAHGKDVVVSGHVDKFVFARGSLTIRHRNTAQHQHFDKVTCYGVFTERGVYRVIRGSGAYAGAHGHGNFRVKGTSFGCGKQPRIFQLVLQGAGPLSV